MLGVKVEQVNAKLREGVWLQLNCTPLNHLGNFVCTRYSVMTCDKCEGLQRGALELLTKPAPETSDQLLYAALSLQSATSIEMPPGENTDCRSE